MTKTQSWPLCVDNTDNSIKELLYREVYSFPPHIKPPKGNKN